MKECGDRARLFDGEASPSDSSRSDRVEHGVEVLPDAFLICHDAREPGTRHAREHVVRHHHGRKDLRRIREAPLRGAAFVEGFEHLGRACVDVEVREVSRAVEAGHALGRRIVRRVFGHVHLGALFYVLPCGAFGDARARQHLDPRRRRIQGGRHELRPRRHDDHERDPGTERTERGVRLAPERNGHEGHDGNPKRTVSGRRHEPNAEAREPLRRVDAQRANRRGDGDDRPHRDADHEEPRAYDRTRARALREHQRQAPVLALAAQRIEAEQDEHERHQHDDDEVEVEPARRERRGAVDLVAPEQRRRILPSLHVRVMRMKRVSTEREIAQGARRRDGGEPERHRLRGEGQDRLACLGAPERFEPLVATLPELPGHQSLFGELCLAPSEPRSYGPARRRDEHDEQARAHGQAREATHLVCDQRAEHHAALGRAARTVSHLATTSATTTHSASIASSGQ